MTAPMVQNGIYSNAKEVTRRATKQISHCRLMLTLSQTRNITLLNPTTDPNHIPTYSSPNSSNANPSPIRQRVTFMA